MRKLICSILSLFLVCQAIASNFDTTWAGTEWNTTWTDVSNSGACDTVNTFGYVTTDGNPTNCRKQTCTGRNDIASRHSEWAGTWESLGVTAGWTITTVQMLDIDTKLLTDTGCDSATMGPLELHNSADVLVATLWVGRTVTAAEGSFNAAGSQTAQSVGSLTASNSNIELWLNGSLDIANSVAQSCVTVFDNLDIRIVATYVEPDTNIFRRKVIRVGTRFNKWVLESVEDI